MFEIAQLQSAEEKQKKIEDALKLMKKVPSLQIDFMKWRMELRKDKKNWKERQEGEFDDLSNKDQEETEGKQLKGLEILYHDVIEKVIYYSNKNHRIHDIKSVFHCNSNN